MFWLYSKKLQFPTNVIPAVSFQLTFVSDEVLPPELSTNFTFGETAYTLYTNSFLNFGQVSYFNT
jgi:apyrase